jgi:hypothetical protein
MKYDYYLTKSSFSPARFIEDVDCRILAMVYTPEAEAAFIAGASALGLSVYDNDTEQGLCGTLDQAMHEGTEG